MSYKVIDNFMPENEFRQLQEVMMGVYMPWYFNPFIVSQEVDAEKFQFTHTFFNGYNSDGGGQSPTFEMLHPFLNTLNPKEILRIKANLGTRTLTNEQGGFHVDFTDTVCKTAVFYLNTNNGHTIFDVDGELVKVDSLENRFVTFDSNIMHTGVSQTDTSARFVLNINYTE